MSGTFASLPTTQANRFSQMYVNGFVDVSCGNVLLRGDAGANHLILQNGDISLNGRLFSTRDISLNGNLNIGGNLSVSQFSSNKTITTTNYQLIVSEDISLNGRLLVSSDASLNGRLYVSGNVGIGTTNPTTILSLNGGSSLANKQIAISANYVVSTVNDTLGALSFYTNNFGIENARIQSCCNGSGADNNADLRFFTRMDYFNFTERMRIDRAGNVGIGTTNPQYTLDVSSVSTQPFRVGVGATNALVVNTVGNVGIGTANPTKMLTVAGDALINELTVGRGAGAVSSNTAVGSSALDANTATGLYNTAVGFGSLQSNTTGSTNTSFGINALNLNTVSNNNTAVGGSALQNTTGANNTAIGASAGNTGTANTTGSSNTYLGYNTGSNAANYSNSTAIGAGATINASNQIVLGTASESVIIPRNIRYLSPPLVAYAFTSTTQSLPNGSDTLVNFQTADARNSTYTGLTYSAGTFTNSNSYSIGLSVSAVITFGSSSVGFRVVFINTSAQGRLALTDCITNSGSEVAVLTTSANFVLNAGETFSVFCYQTSGAALNIGYFSSLYSTRCSVMVF